MRLNVCWCRSYQTRQHRVKDREAKSTHDNTRFLRGRKFGLRDT